MRRFYIAKATEDRIGTKDLEIRVTKREKREAEVGRRKERKVRRRWMRWGDDERTENGTERRDILCLKIVY